MIDPDERVVVIGSGPAGAAAAAQLVSRGVPVTMLDAGVRSEEHTSELQSQR